jgi:hypothetical protein
MVTTIETNKEIEEWLCLISGGTIAVCVYNDFMNETRSDVVFV